MNKKIAVAVCLVATMSVNAENASWYVDAGVEKTAEMDGSEKKPFRTIQAAIEKADDGDTIHVAKGVYNDGETLAGNNLNRINVSKANLKIVSDDPHEAIIEGRLSSVNPGTGCGDDSVRAVYFSANGSYLKGFVIRNGSTVAGSTYATASGGAVYGGAVIDCIITNCATGYRGVIYNSTLMNCRVYPQVSGTYTAAACSAYNCVFKNAETYGNGVILNCSYIGMGPRSQSAGAEVYNSFVEVCRSGVNFYRCYYLGTTTTAYDGSTKITAENANLDPLTGCPRRGSWLIDAGSEDYYDEKYIAAYKSTFAQYDEAMKPRHRGVGVDIGALEYQYENELSKTLTESDLFKVVDSTADVWTNGVHAVLVPVGNSLTGVWENPSGAAVPSEITFTAEVSVGAVLKVFLNGAAEPTWTIVATDASKTITYLSKAADRLKFVCEGDVGQAVLSAFMSTAHKCVYADAVNGNDAWDGSTDFEHMNAAAGIGPVLSLQKAVEVAEVGEKVYAATGVYNRVETWDYNCSNRLVIAKANVGVIAIGPSEDAIIEGAADQESVAAGGNGCGGAAVRCVRITGSGSYVRGFTLRKGFTGLKNGTSNDYGTGACLSGGLAIDCRMSESGADYRGTVHNATVIRCQIDEVQCGTYSLYQSKAYDCVVASSSSYGVGPYVNCTFLLGSAQGAGAGDNQRANFYNCYAGGTRKWTTYHRSYASGGWNATACYHDDDCKLVSPELVKLDSVTRRPQYDSELVDKGSIDYYTNQFPVAALKFMGLDFAGGQRIYNAAIDIGAGEYDWREDFASRLKHLKRYDLVVDSAAPAVTTNTLGLITLSDATSIVVEWNVASAGEVSFETAETGSGQLEVTCDGVPVAADHVTGRGSICLSSGMHRFVFAYSGVGTATLSDFREQGKGLLLLVR